MKIKMITQKPILIVEIDTEECLALHDLIGPMSRDVMLQYIPQEKTVTIYTFWKELSKTLREAGLKK